MKHYYVYILASEKNGTLYIGVTSNILKRGWEHKSRMINGFSKKYKVSRLVYIESFEDPNLAIKREKQLKKWNRDWKIKLIEKNNPEWKDLYNSLLI